MMVRYLTGASNEGIEAIAFERRIGLMLQPRSALHTHVHKFPTWAADNGAFTKARGGFSAARFRRMLALPELQTHGDRCEFVVAPDCLIVHPDGTIDGDARGTLEQFEPWAVEIRDRGFPVAFVAQNGVEAMLDAVPWELVDVLFIGGDTAWKLGDAARACAAEARHRGKGVHMGRVNSCRRLAAAAAILADTADGTFVRFAPANVGRVEEWLDKLGEGVQALLPWRC
jgi:hypothetical protein